MKFIPVLDLMGGQVVHARRGERSKYAPLQSALCAGSDPTEIAAALLQFFPFSILYIADIDAIQGRGDNRAVILALRSRFPDIELWIDCGIARFSDYLAWQKMDLGRAVIGTETHPESYLISALTHSAALLSLDYHETEFAGPSDLDRQPESWPGSVIVLTLARVGSDLGPDFERLAAIKKIALDKNIYAAGGVRSVADLEQLKAIGIAGVLIASALHDGRTRPGELKALA